MQVDPRNPRHPYTKECQVGVEQKQQEAAETGFHQRRSQGGGEVQVFIKAMSTQYGRFMVTFNTNVGDKKASDCNKRQMEGEAVVEMMRGWLSQGERQQSRGQ